MISKSGSPIYNHEFNEKELCYVEPNVERRIAIANHIEENIGPIHMVYSEFEPYLISLDILHIAPTKTRPYHLFITSGMSDVAMNMPTEELNDFKYAELIIALPLHWKISQESFKEEKYYFPFRLLKYLSRMPIVFDTFLGFGHTVQNGHPMDYFADNTKLCSSLLAYPNIIRDEDTTIKLQNNEYIHFYQVIPLYAEEMQFKLDNGIDELFRLFSKYEISSIIDVRRKNICKTSK